MKNGHNFFLAIALAVVSTASAGYAQGRTWGFSRDTVYEWASQGDSVMLVNSGVDTLAFDSVAFELVRPLGDRYEIAFDFYRPVNTVNPRGYKFTHFDGQVGWPPSSGPNTLKVGGGGNALMKKFRGEIQVSAVNKRSAIEQNDTVVARLIFISSAGRGRDTLVFLSKQDGPVALSPARPFKSGSVEGYLYDLRGRRAEKMPKGVRVPFRPIFERKN